MITTTKDKVIFSRDTWNKLKKSSYFRELIEVIEDSEELESAENDTEFMIDYDEYRAKRMAKINV